MVGKSLNPSLSDPVNALLKAENEVRPLRRVIFHGFLRLVLCNEGLPLRVFIVVAVTVTFEVTAFDVSVG
jgi:hypothetical protein